MDELISVIVPVYNSENYLLRCITSIQNQTYSNLQIIIINDGSTDKSIDIIKSMADEDSRIEYVDKPNEGISKTRNKGLSLVKGNYVSFVDSDDYINERMIEKLYRLIKHCHSDIAICFDPSWDKLDGTVETIGAEDYCFQKPYSSLVAWGGLYSDKSIAGLQFDEDIHVSEDILFKSSAIRKSEKITFLYEPLYNYVIYENSACHGPFTKKKLSEIEAWKRIVNLFEGTKTGTSAKIALNQRCRHVLSLYANDKSFGRSDFRYCISEYRKSIVANLKNSNIRGKISCLVFYIMPCVVLKLK